MSLLNEIPFFVPKLFAVFMYVFVIKYKTNEKLTKYQEDAISSSVNVYGD